MELPSDISVPVKARRRHAPQFKAQVLTETSQPGVSVAAVARRHDLNANLIHKWRKAAQREPLAAPAFIPLPAPHPSSGPIHHDVRLEVPTAQGTATLFWPCEQVGLLAELIQRLS